MASAAIARESATLRRSMVSSVVDPLDELSPTLDPLYIARDAIVAEEDVASRLLEEENIRLVESRAAVETERDALRIEILHIKNELESMKEAYAVPLHFNGKPVVTFPRCVQRPCVCANHHQIHDHVHQHDQNSNDHRIH